MRILLLYFEPFGGESVNAGAEAVKLLPCRVGGAEILTQMLPVSFSRGPADAVNAMRTLRPDAVLAVGQATGRCCVTPERRAVNCMRARIPDNDGAQPQEEKIEPDGPDFYESSLPAVEMAEAMERAGVPAAVSDSAGTFVCNAVLYGMLHDAYLHDAKRPSAGMGCGFIHVPCLPEQAGVGVPSLPAGLSSRALLAALTLLAETSAKVAGKRRV